jgi:predicted PurR-regulated permease PerM
MDSMGSPVVDPLPSNIRDRALGIIAMGTLLALLYFGRDVLVPITLALILSLLVAPLVRALKRVGIGHTFSVLLAVVLLALSFGAVAAVIGAQLVHMVDNVPEYEHTIEEKLEKLNQVTVVRFNALTGQAGRNAARRANHNAAREPDDSSDANSPAPLAVELHEPPANPLQVVQRILGSVWVPIEMAGIVIVVLVFVLLEQEALRDRFIRIAGGTDIRLTTLAINDAGERLSRFFVSQFAVNVGVGLVVWIGLSLLALPHPLLWATLTGVLRFVPYVGVWIAALLATVLAAAVDPLWSLTLAVLSLFVIVELLAGQLVEPQLYGHTTGLSPLSVVVAAIFWSWLWGPIGLIVSTPLTLCLLVAGRHIKGLSLLDVLLGDTHALTMPQRFYQRALSADADEIIDGAREFLKRNSFATYCDLVLLPALHLARLDLDSGAITPDQQSRMRSSIVEVIGAIGGVSRRRLRRGDLSTVLAQTSAGRLLRQQREEVSGRWQGPLVVAPGSVALCIGLGSFADDLATELLVRILRDQKIDARHMSIEDLKVTPPPNAAEAVSLLYIVSALPSVERTQGEAVAAQARARFPQGCVVSVLLPGMLLQPVPQGAPDIVSIDGADKTATSLGHAVQICLDMYPRTSRA